jgi:integrase
VRLYKGKGGFRTCMFPLGTEPSKMQDWIDGTYRDYRRRHPRAIAGTLSADVVIYLRLLVDRPKLQQQRTTQLAWWCKQFGDRPRWSLTAVELETALNTLTAAGLTASTVQKYRTALYHLYTKLDGKSEPNPLRDVARPSNLDPLPRAIPYDIIEAIFDAMPDRRYAKKLDPETAARVYAAATAPKANRSQVARDFGLSETMVRKMIDRGGDRFDAATIGKTVLRVMAYTGLPPEQIRALDLARDVNFQEPSVIGHARKKGGGTRPVRLPLVQEGVDALKAFAALGTRPGKDGKPIHRGRKFSTSSVNAAFKRGIDRLCDQLEADPETRPVGEQLREELKDVTAYALRHSFLTEAQLATGNINTTQTLAMHADARMTRRYLLAAVAPELQVAADLLKTRWAGQHPGNKSTDEKPKTAKKPSKPTDRKSGRRLTKHGAK